MPIDSKPLTMNKLHFEELRAYLSGFWQGREFLIEFNTIRAALAEAQEKLARVGKICGVCFTCSWEPTPDGERCGHCWLQDCAISQQAELERSQQVSAKLVAALIEFHDRQECPWCYDDGQCNIADAIAEATK